MYAITVQQPWAWAIFNGKNVENRTRIGAWRRLEGERVAIHAGQRWSDRGAASELVIDAYDRAHDLPATGSSSGVPLESRTFGTSVLLGTVLVTDVHLDRGRCCAPWGERSYDQAVGPEGEYRRRRDIVHLSLAEPRLIPGGGITNVNGRLGPWLLPAELEEELCHRLAP